MEDSPNSENVTASRRRLVLELGRGGMGTVFLAVASGPSGFHKLKVIKHLRPDLSEEPEIVEMFLEEARLSAQLNHPNIVQTNEAGFDGTNYFIEMEYLEGQSLEGVGRALSKSGGIPIPLAMWMYSQALAGLHHAHELHDVRGKALSIVHRDVSPHNVFVTYDGVVKVLDFGIAKAADSAIDTATGILKGKLTYMAPEQARRGKVDRRADVFAVGVMLWQTLAQKRFWEGRTELEIMLELDSGVFAAPSREDGSLPEALTAICMKAIARDPNDRFQTAAEFQAALEGWLDEQPQRVGTRQVATLVSELFAKRREMTRAEIEKHMRDVPAKSDPYGLPTLSLLIGDGPGSGGSMRTGSRSVAANATLGPHSSRSKRGPIAPAQAAQSSANESGYEQGNETKPSRSLPQSPMVVGVDAGKAIESSEPSGQTSTGTAAPLSRAARTSPSQTARARSLRAKWVTAVAVASCVATGATAYVHYSRAVVAGGPIDAAPSSAATGPRECETSAACMRRNGGKPAVCRSDGVCVLIESSECSIRGEPADIGNDATLWLGVMFDPHDEIDLSFINAIELGQRDFREVASGIPFPNSSAPARPVGLVVCDDSHAAETAARHLAIDLKVPAVIGFHRNDEAVSLSNSVFVPNDVLVASINSSTLVTKTAPAKDATRLVWRFCLSSVQTAPAVAEVVSQVYERQLRTGTAPIAGDLRVALVRAGNQRGLTLAGALFSALHFNGKTALENGPNYREVVIDEKALQDNGAALASVAHDIAEWKPQVVIYAARPDLGGMILSAVEDAWPTAEKTRPRYVQIDPPAADSMASFFEKGADRRRRVLTVMPPATTAANALFTNRFNEIFRTKTNLADSPGYSYDAFYTIAYAAFAVGNGPVTGPNLARALTRLLPPGESLDVGPTRIFDAFNVLRAGGSFDLNGAATKLDFDRASGDTAADLAIICAVPDGENGVAEVESGLTFDSSTGKLRGELHCR